MVQNPVDLLLFFRYEPSEKLEPESWVSLRACPDPGSRLLIVLPPNQGGLTGRGGFGTGAGFGGLIAAMALIGFGGLGNCIVIRCPGSWEAASRLHYYRSG